MSRNTMLGVIGGALIALSVFFNGDTATFNGDALKGGFTIVLFAAGILIIVFLLMRNLTWAAYATIAATTLLIVKIIDGGLSITLGLVLFVVGVVLAILGTLTGKR